MRTHYVVTSSVEGKHLRILGDDGTIIAEGEFPLARGESDSELAWSCSPGVPRAELNGRGGT